MVNAFDIPFKNSNEQSFFLFWTINELFKGQRMTSAGRDLLSFFSDVSLQENTLLRKDTSRNHENWLYNHECQSAKHHQFDSWNYSNPENFVSEGIFIENHSQRMYNVFRSGAIPEHNLGKTAVLALLYSANLTVLSSKTIFFFAENSSRF